MSASAPDRFPPGPAVGAAAGLPEAWAGEARLNLVRLAALVLFYGYHLVSVFLSRGDIALADPYHVAVTALVMVWAAGAAALWLYLARRPAPPALKYVVTAWDAVLVTTLVVLAGGPRSPLVVLLFLVVASAPLRLSVRLVYVATLLALAAYAFLLAHYAFYEVGYDRYYSDASLRVPRTQEAVTALALLAAGVLAGQVVRQALRLAGGRPAEVGASEDERAAEARRDSVLVAAGLVITAVEAAAGVAFSLTLGPPSLAGYPAWPVAVALGLLFAAAVVAAVVEALRSDARAGRDAATTP